MRIKRQFIFALWIFLVFLGVILFFWSIRSVPLADIVEVLAGLDFWKINILLSFNVLILLIAPLRWWLILKAQKNEIPYLPLAAYRLAGSAVSYFTPGQNFGGEPIQVLALQKRHKISGSKGLASITLDRAIELFGNFTVLALGISFVISRGLLPQFELGNSLALAFILLLIPVVYVGLLWFGYKPLGFILKPFRGVLLNGVRNAEEQLIILIRNKPNLFLEGLACSALVWSALFFEFWLALDFLGLRVDFSQLVLVVTAGRLALLAPTPGALGALEASQMMAIGALGFDPAIGLSLGLYIRARDILFSIFGLALGATSLR